MELGELVYVVVNIAYIVLSFLVLRFLKIKSKIKSSYAYISLELFVASVFFTIGLLLFNIPLVVFGANNPETVERMKEAWYGIPSVFFGMFLFFWMAAYCYRKLSKSSRR